MVFPIFATLFPKEIRFHLIGGLLVLTLLMYLSTGTLSPYANTLSGYSIVTKECQYLYNGDYWFHKALYRMLDGQARERWEKTIASRRIAYNIIAYPLMKIMNYELGGIATNFMLAWIAILSFCLFVYHKMGRLAAVLCAWLLCAYPGFAYFGGQPFFYSLIAPCSLWLYILLQKLDAASSLKETFLFSCLMGLIFIGYDLIVFFGPAACLLLLKNRRFSAIPTAVAGMILPLLIWLLILRYHFRMDYIDSNSNVYLVILKSYLSPANMTAWAGLLKQVPKIFAHIFLFSSFLFIPVLFLCALAVNILILKKKGLFSPPEISILISVLAVFFFNNLAPPYPQHFWQMRGDWIARIYEPVFVALLVYFLKVASTVQKECQHNFPLKKTLILISAIAVLGNCLIAAGPFLGNPFSFSSNIYWRYYKHDNAGSMQQNLKEYGRRPLGFCKPALQ